MVDTFAIVRSGQRKRLKTSSKKQLIKMYRRSDQISESDVDQYVDYLRIMQGHLRVSLMDSNF